MPCLTHQEKRNALSRALIAELITEMEALAAKLRHKVYESADYAEGIRAFKEQRPPRFRGE